MTPEEATKWIIGLVGALFTGGAMFWARAIWGAVKEIRTDVGEVANGFAEFRGTVTAQHEATDDKIEHMDRRINRIEERTA